MRAACRAIIVVSAIVACAKEKPAGTSTAHLADVGWLPENRARIERMIGETGKGVAVFDWDNTMMRNDIGDATFFYMLRHDEVLQPPDRDWSHTNKHLTADARTALSAVCNVIAEPNAKRPTSRSPDCAD